MPVSVLDLFKIGIGPSSSHTVGPMVAARRFLDELGHTPAAVTVELFGSLALTGKGHGTDRAVLLGLAGERPETVDPDRPGSAPMAVELVFHRDRSLPEHPNGLRFTAGTVSRSYFSVGGGFVVGADEIGQPVAVGAAGPYPFRSAEQLLAMAAGQTIAAVVLDNECAVRPEVELRQALDRIWQAMQDCIARGLSREGLLPGGLNLPRRAAAVQSAARRSQLPLGQLDEISAWALAVNEENAAGGRVVTAPTNGAAGIVPAVMMHYVRHCGGGRDGCHAFLLTAAAVGSLIKENASISGAEVGCQGEVGTASAMAAAGLVAALGGSNAQVENAAEIAMEHHLGLTCDPVAGLVQVPCIERNAMGAVKAITAAHLALAGDGRHSVSLDKVIETMRQTGADMQAKYKETSLGGLAVNVVSC
jgi:L-serine dehydratase